MPQIPDFAGSAFHVDRAVRLAGQMTIARACKRTYQAVVKWRERGLPRSAWTQEDGYAEAIERATNGAVTRDDLLPWRNVSTEELLQLQEAREATRTMSVVRAARRQRA